ncbi:MAG: type Z 30S ribosomal protein S14 [Planctomycetota bacterium]
MAKTCMKVKASRPPKYKTRAYNRCQLCGRPHAVYRKFQVCRCCFRRLALEGKIPGLAKASW